MPPRHVVFKGQKYRLSGNYYRRNVWGSKGPSNLHRAVWEDANGPITKGYEIHHIDGNHFNNDLANLEIMPASDHQRMHALARVASGELKPPGKLARKRAAVWHASDDGRQWHSKHGRATWTNRKWTECACVMCGQRFMSPYPTRSMYCHKNCKQDALRLRRGGKVGVRPDDRKPRLLFGKRNPGQQQ